MTDISTQTISRQPSSRPGPLWIALIILISYFGFTTNSYGQFAIPYCTTTLMLTDVGGNGIVCPVDNPCTWSWSGAGLNFSCATCQLTNITAPAPGTYTAVLSFNGGSNGALTYALTFGADDTDGDSFNDCDDCNDLNPLEKPNQVWYRDIDGDGYAATGASSITQCSRPSGYRHQSELIAITGDCNDGNPAVHPGATEVCDNTDNNCNNSIDEGVLSTFYRDADNDGFGNPAISQQACSMPSGFVANNTDCNDGNAALNPTTVWYLDADNDNYFTGGGLTQCTSPGVGYRYTGLVGGGDCNDGNAALNPTTVWYLDADNDSYYTGSGITQCTSPGAGYRHTSLNGGNDCDDGNANINPGTPEVCDNIDNNCNLSIDEGLNCCPATTILYVNDDAAGNNDGTSWTNAFNDLQDALALSGNCSNVTEIWVAEGTYKPTNGTDRNISFSMKNGVAILGGFPNAGNPGLNDRDWGAYETILSGDIATTGLNSDNSRRIIYNSGLDNTAILDGFTIRDAFNEITLSGREGAGMLNNNASPRILNCTFRSNISAKSGGGVANNNSSPDFINCLLLENVGSLGGAVYTELGVPTFTNCTFANNMATFRGGAIAGNLNATNQVLTNCILWGNSAGENGYDVFFNNQFATATVTYSIVEGGYSGTGNLDVDPLFVDAANGDFTLQQCSPAIDAGENTANNEPKDLAGDDRIVNATGSMTIDMGAYEYQGSYDVCTTCLTSGYILYVNDDASGNNEGTSWTNAFNDLQDALALAGNCPNVTEIWVAEGTYKPTNGTNRNISFSMKNGVAIYGGFPNAGNPGLNDRDWATHETILSGDIGTVSDSDNSYHVILNNNLDNTAVLDGFTISGGYADGVGFSNSGGGIYNNLSSPKIVNCEIFHNFALGVGGGICNFNSSSPTITYCRFFANSSESGGGMVNDNNSSPTVTNCSFTANSVMVIGGGMANSFSFPIVTNCSFSGNSASNGGAMSNNGSTPILTNCILWGNSSGIVDFISSPATVSYSIVQGGYPGTGNLDVDPLFVDAAGGDLRLDACSPAIDAGTSNGAPSNDLDGNPRPVNNGIDMGAYEFQDAPTPLVADCQGQTVMLGANGSGSLQASALDDGSTGCGLLTFTVDNASILNYDCTDLGPHSVTLTVTDERGQTATCLATVTVVDDEAPTANCQSVEVQLDHTGSGSTTAEAVNNNSYDNCGVASLSLSQTDFDCSHLGNNTVTLTVMDVNGNPATCQATVLVLGEVSASTIWYLDADNDDYYTGNGIMQCTSPGPGYRYDGLAGGGDCNDDNPDEFPGQTWYIDADGDTYGGSTMTSCERPEYGFLLNELNGTGTDDCEDGDATINPSAIEICDGIDNDCDGFFDGDDPDYVDNTMPSLSCPANIDVAMDAGQCGATLTWAAPIATDNCDDAFTAMQTLGDPSGTFFGEGTQTIEYSATDVAGNTSSCSFTVTVQPDAEMPSLSCPANIDVPMDAGLCGAVVSWTTPTVMDNCDASLTATQTLGDVSGSFFGEGTQTIEYSATDAAGNTGSCSFTVTVQPDAEMPSLTCPANIDVPMDAGFCGAVVSWTAPTVMDNCDASLTAAQTLGDVSGSFFGEGTQTIEYSATDAAGNTGSCSFTVTVQPNTVAPTINCPDNVTVECGEATDPTATGEATATAVCGVPTLTWADDFSAACGNTGVITRTWTATDQDGLVSTCVQLITIEDTQAPSITGPLANGISIEVECNLLDPTWTAFEDITAELVLDDACTATGDIALAYEEELMEEGTCGVSDFLSIWRRSWTATDACGNSSTYTFFVRIVDTQGPAWTFFPADVEIACTDHVPFQQATAEDDCSTAEVSYEDEIIPGTCVGSYTIRRRWTSADGCGNATVNDQLIQVNDHTAPQIRLIDEYVSNYTDGQEVYVDCGQYGKIIELAYAARAVDDCSGETEVIFTYEDFGLFSCAEFGYIGHLTTTWSSTDDCGNTSEVTLFWYLTDNTAPTFQGVPTDACTSILPPVPTVTAVDDCEFAVVEFYESEPFDCEGGQYVERTWTATDVCGNATSYTQRITLTSGQGPGITVDYPGLQGLPNGSTAILEADCGGNGDVAVPDLRSYVIVNGGCSAANATTDLVLLREGECAIDGFLVRYALRVSARDVCGNISEYELFIEFVDTTPPTISGPAALTVSCGEEIPAVTATDACGRMVTLDHVDVEPIEASCVENPRSYERLWTATDACGNTSTFSQQITILDNEGPVFYNVPDDACDDIAMEVPVTAYDKCAEEEVAVQMTEVTATMNGCGEVLTRTWTATDACGNVSTATQQVFFTDNQAPELSFAHPMLVGMENGDELILPVDFVFGSPDAPYDFGDGAILVEDNCASNLIPTLTMQRRLVRSCIGAGFLGQVALTWTVTDPCGNAAQISIILRYEDTYGPDIFGVPADLTIYCNDPIPAPAEVLVQDNYDNHVIAVFAEEYVEIAQGLRLVRSWTATDDCGNTTVETQYIDIIDNTLDYNFTYPEVVNCNSNDNQMAIQVTGGTAPYTYHWEMMDCDGFLTSDPGQSVVYCTVGYTMQNFSVKVTDANGCQRICTMSVSCENGANYQGLQEGSSSGSGANDFQLYPNPADDYILLRAPEIADEAAVTVTIYSMLGQEVCRQKIDYWSAEGLRLDTSTYPEGTYTIRIAIMGQAPITKQVVIQH